MESDSRPWLRCYRCWSQNLEVQVHYEGIHRIDADTGERAEVVDELQEAVVQCLDCMHDQPHLGFADGRVQPIEDRWERMVAGTPWVASCTVTVDAEAVETCSGPEAADALSYAAFGDHGTREFFTHVRFHKHDEERIVIHLLVELYARSADEATEVLEEASPGHADPDLARRGVAPAGRDRLRAALNVAVVGHVEWVTFATVEHVPAAGAIVHATDSFEEAAGGGAVAAVQLARLNGTCRLLTALGDDETGRRAHARLSELGVEADVVWRAEPTRRAFVHLDAMGERSITVIGERLVPHGSDALAWSSLADADAVYFTGGDVAAAAAARRARVLVATPRAAAALAHVEADALVYSAGDRDEVRWAESVAARARVRTAGAQGGDWSSATDGAGVWAAEPTAAAAGDAYGCGDSFAAGLTLGLADHGRLADAVALGARCGAACAGGRGPYSGTVPSP